MQVHRDGRGPWIAKNARWTGLFESCAVRLLPAAPKVLRPAGLEERLRVLRGSIVARRSRLFSVAGVDAKSQRTDVIRNGRTCDSLSLKEHPGLPLATGSTAT